MHAYAHFQIMYISDEELNLISQSNSREAKASISISLNVDCIVEYKSLANYHMILLEKIQLSYGK